MTNAAGNASRRALLLGAGAAVLAACTAKARRVATSPRPAPATPSSAGAPSVPAPVASARGAVVVRHADTGRAEVALTFHGSGDPALAERLLAEAERAH